jgi:hypothetical protein
MTDPTTQNPESPACSTHPNAPHGFNRDQSHTLDRYVCDCEGWISPEEWAKRKRSAQSREPTAEQLPKPDGEVMGGTARMYYLNDRQTGVTVYTTASTLGLSKEAYAAGIQAGREALLTELRAGGVELPEPFSEYMLNVCLLTDALDYGDRRAAAAVQDFQHWCETCEGSGKVYQEGQKGCHVGGEYPCPDCDGNGYWIEAAPKNQTL